MRAAMAIRLGKTTRACVLAAISAALLAWAASAPAPAGAASACSRFGESRPDELSADQAQRAILCLLNEQRERAGLRALRPDRKLEKAAERHNRRMDGTGCFDHACSGEAELEKRLQGVGYLDGGLSRWAYGENIAWGLEGRGTPDAIVTAWMDSPPHRANILNGSFREIGIAFAEGTPEAGNRPGGIYTTDFGLRVD
jgi:uncharacterized protein YkwD